MLTTCIREKILTGEESDNHLKYLTSLVDLLATCAEVTATPHSLSEPDSRVSSPSSLFLTRGYFSLQGENRFIESLCQTILPMEELLWVLNHESIDYNIKKAYLKYLHWVYMRSSGSFIDTGAGELTHDV